MHDRPAPIEAVPPRERLWLIFATYLARAAGQSFVPAEFLIAKPDDTTRRS